MASTVDPSNGERGKLPEFSGDREMSSRFLRQFRNYLCLNEAKFSTNSAKVALFFSSAKETLQPSGQTNVLPNMKTTKMTTTSRTSDGLPSPLWQKGSPKTLTLNLWILQE